VSREKTVGFIGLGAMGLPMAACIAKAGLPLVVHDAHAARTEEVAGITGARAMGSPADVARHAALLITMLPNSSIVERVMFGEEGLVAASGPGTVLADMSSGQPEKTIELARRAKAAGLAMIDAPVSGGVPRARTGELAIMLGGDAAACDTMEPVMAAMGRTLRTGTVGTAHAMKALNNLVSAGGFLIGIEAMLIGRKFGLEPSIMVDVLNASTGMNNSTQKKFKQFVISRSFDSGFKLDLMVKDLNIALDLAQSGEVDTPFAQLCRDMWRAAVEAGVGDDHTAMARFSEKIGGVELG